MAEGKLAEGIEKILSTSAKGIGTFQTNVDNILWGNPSPPSNKKSSAKFENKSTQPSGNTAKKEVTFGTSAESTRAIQYTAVPTEITKPSVGQRLLATGLFNALDALLSVDLCNVVTYAFDNINIKNPPRPERSTWSPAQIAFYTLQDRAGEVVTYIDKYTAYPNVFIGSYIGVGPNALPPSEAVNKTNAPVQGGISVQKYNTYYLLQSIGEAFAYLKSSVNNPTEDSLFTSEDILLIRQIPGLGSNLNFLNDFLGNINKYTDYTQISTPELLSLQSKIGKVRATCVTIQNLNFKNATALVGNFVGIDIRKEVQKLSEFVDITRIVPTLKEINNSVRTFIRIANQIQKILSIGQFVIKVAILLIKVFRFIQIFFKTLPAPSMFLTVGAQVTIQEVATRAKEETNGLTRVLRSTNSLLGAVTSFIRYLTVNANELLIRLDTLILTLEACNAFKGSDVLDELKQTRESLKTTLEQLATYVVSYDSKTDPNNAIYGTYEIRVVEEEVVDTSITNKRRRGIALDRNGAIVTQSDLTFATNSQVIIQEVKQKLVSLKLVRPELGSLDLDTTVVLSESLNYLDNNDILQNDLNISTTPVDAPNNLDENQGLGLNAFINNLKGGKKLRSRVKQALANSKDNLSSQIAAEKIQASQAISRP